MDLVTNVVQTLASPVASISGSAADGLGDFTYGFSKARRLAVENKRLSDRLSALALYAETSNRLQRDVDSLRTLLGLPNYGRIKIEADVIGFIPHDNRLTIAVGANRGVKAGMPVVAGSGLVGTVQSVAGNRSQVLLLTSRGLTIGGIVMNRNPSPAGLLHGENSTTLSLSFNDPKAPVQIGDIVGSSGLSQFIPRGIPVGKVIQVEDDPAYGERRAIVDPFVSVGELREVVVLR